MPVIRPWPASISSAPSFEGSILVKSLMSAPAENVKMLLDAITTARISLLSWQCFQRAPNSWISCGLIGFAGGRLSQITATSPRVSSSTVSLCSKSESGWG